MPILLGIAGKARSGKDTVGRLLWRNHGFETMAFAEPVKTAVHDTFGLMPLHLCDDSYKDVYHDYWGMTTRELYQRFGTEAMQGTFGPDIWVKAWTQRYITLRSRDCDVVVTDVRFEHEAKAIRDWGGHIVHLWRPEAGLKGSEGAHVSEAGIEKDVFDYQIENTGTLEDLELAVADMVKGLRA